MINKRKAILCILAVTVLCGGLFLLSQLFPVKHFEKIQAEARANGLSPYLVAAQINAESHYDKEAVSEKGARGLMQLMPETAKWCAKEMKMENFSEQQLENEAINIKIGTWYLAYLVSKTDSMEWALAAYNAGLSNVAEWKTQGVQSVQEIPFPETKAYVKKVMAQEKIYALLYSFLNFR